MRALKLAILLTLATATVSPQASAGNRAEHWSGADVAFGEPFPCVAGLGIGFNVGDDVRLTGGVGTFGLWTTYGIDSKYFATSSPWSPYFGVGIGYMAGTHGQYLAWNLNFDHAFYPYFELGMDFQSDLGVHVTFNLAGSAPAATTLILPGIAIGWYF